MTAGPALQVAVVGLGYFSRFHLESWRTIEKTELAGLTDLDHGRALDIAAEYETRAFSDIETMIAETRPDILDIVTPPPTHAGFIHSALGRVKTVICQKPFCTSIEEARSVAEQSRKANCNLIVHENFRFQPWHREIKRLIDGGRIGRVYQALFRLRPGDGQGADAYLSRQPFFQKMPRFLIHETGVHYIDLFRWMFGEVTAVYSDLRRLNPAVAGEDAGMLILEHQSGVRSVFDGNRLCDHVAADRRKTMGELIVEGESGTIRLDGHGNVRFRPFGSNIEEKCEFDRGSDGFGGGCVEALNRHVVAHLVEGMPIENDAGSYLPVIAIDEAAYRSNERGARIEIGDGNHG